jgi:hypothetical protein
MFSADYEQKPSCGMSECQYQHIMKNNHMHTNMLNSIPHMYNNHGYNNMHNNKKVSQYVQQPSVQQYAQQQTMPQYVQQPPVQQYAQPCTQSYVHKQTEYVQQLGQQTPQYAQHYQTPPQQQSSQQQNYAESSTHPSAVWADYKATWVEYWYFRPVPSCFQQTQQQIQPQQALPNVFQLPFVQANITPELLEVFDCESDPEELEDENSNLSQVCDQESGTQPNRAYEKWGVDHHAPKQTYTFSMEELDIFLQCIISMEKSEQCWHTLESCKYSQADSKTAYPLKNHAVHM